MMAKPARSQTRRAHGALTSVSHFSLHPVLLRRHGDLLLGLQGQKLRLIHYSWADWDIEKEHSNSTVLNICTNDLNNNLCQRINSTGVEKEWGQLDYISTICIPLENLTVLTGLFCLCLDRSWEHGQVPLGIWNVCSCQTLPLMTANELLFTVS